jgi:hypothetical protein
LANPIFTPLPFSGGQTSLWDVIRKKHDLHLLDNTKAGATMAMLAFPLLQNASRIALDDRITRRGCRGCTGQSELTQNRYEDGNDAERLSQDQAFRLIGSAKIWERGGGVAFAAAEVLSRD